MFTFSLKIFGREISQVKSFARTMSKQQQRLNFSLSDTQKIFPELTNILHKGQCGRIGIIGGSSEYTGAPYFSAITSLRLGVDLAHVFCSQDASTAIKCYSPDLIVHPILNDDNGLNELLEWEKRLHAIVVGPGLGRDPKVMDLVEKFINIYKTSGKPLIIDADGLFIITKTPTLLQESKNTILTPNKIEYERLCNAIDKHFNLGGKATSELSLDMFGSGLTIVKKGYADQIFDKEYITSVEGGSACRCGGQGDILSGAVTVFTFWAYLSGSQYPNILGGYSGCYFTKKLNEKVYQEKGRSMTTSDFIEKIPIVCKELFG